MTSHISKYNDLDLYGKSHYQKTNMIRSIKAKMKKFSEHSREYAELQKELNKLKEKK